MSILFAILGVISTLTATAAYAGQALTSADKAAARTALNKVQDLYQKYQNNAYTDQQVLQELEPFRRKAEELQSKMDNDPSSSAATNRSDAEKLEKDMKDKLQKAADKATRGTQDRVLQHYTKEDPMAKDTRELYSKTSITGKATNE